MKLLFRLFSTTLLFSLAFGEVEVDEDYDGEDLEVEEPEPITFGSMMKLEHVSSGYVLHSHDIKYGSGSHQQTVTAYPTSGGDTNSLWQVMAGRHEAASFAQGKALNCGSTIRLRHVNTGVWLHSHSQFRAPLSGQQEVTGFGDLRNTDDGDDWSVECLNETDKEWMRDSEFLMKHKQTSHYLFTSRKSDFNAHNCGAQCPIEGQLEVSASKKRVKGAKWTTGHGVFFKVVESDDQEIDDDMDDDDEDTEKETAIESDSKNGASQKQEL